MANEKDIIKKLFAVVEKQQKTITKMAQVMEDAGIPLDTGAPMAQHLESNKTQK